MVKTRKAATLPVIHVAELWPTGDIATGEAFVTPKQGACTVADTCGSNDDSRSRVFWEWEDGENGHYHGHWDTGEIIDDRNNCRREVEYDYPGSGRHIDRIDSSGTYSGTHGIRFYLCLRL